MKTTLLTLTLFLLTAQIILAQQFNISGKIVDKNSRSPIEFANIVLLDKDSTFQKGVNSDINGSFTINNIKTGEYLLTVSYLGYDTTYKNIGQLEENTNLEEIEIIPSSVLLNEAVITAQSVINKSDRKLITPSKAQIQASSGGLDLIQKLQLPRISVDKFNNTISTLGNGEVQLRINGVQVTTTEIAALSPEEIIRVEYHDDPGLRYGNAAAVLDFITRRKESGGSISTDLTHGIKKNVGFVDDFVSAKYNHKKSEFSTNVDWRYRNIDWVRTNNETFVFPDKEDLSRLEHGLPSKFKENVIKTTLNYSLVEKDKYYFNARFRYNYSDYPNAYSDRNSTLETSYNPIPLTISDHSTEKVNIPALDLYYQRNLKNEQILIFNVVGTYITSKTSREYTEYREETPVTDITSYISGDKYSLIAEGIYERPLWTGKLSAGLKHTQIYSNNEYTGDVITDVSMNQAETYGYIQYQLKKGKFNYTGGLSAVRFYYSQGSESQTKYIMQPSVRVNYNPNDNAYFRYRFDLQSNIPSLGDLNNVQQSIDSLQIRRGNPNLTANYSIHNSFVAGYNKGIFAIDFNARYFYNRKPIMESILFEDGKFIRTKENHKAYHSIRISPTFKIKPWKDYISISVTPGINRYISKGNNYTHTYTNKYIQGSIEAMYKGWMMSLTAMTSYDWFHGETMEEGETLHFGGIGYVNPKWSVMLGAFNPFGGSYKRYEENWSKLAPSKNEIFTNDLKQMFFVKARFNINFGRQFNGNGRRINNADTDTGVMSGSKK